MAYPITIGLIMLLAVVIVALNYRGKAKAERYQAEKQQQRADAAEAVNRQRRQLDATLDTLHETHRQETLHDTDPTHLAARTDFANAWSDADSLHDTEPAANAADSAAVTGAAGATVHFVNRPDLH